MSNKQSRKIPEEEAATPAEVQQAISDLTTSDWYRLRKFANFRMAFIDSNSCGDELLNEAFLRLLGRSRRWDKNKKADFLKVLYGTIRSIADSWHQQKMRAAEDLVLASSLIAENDEGQPFDPDEYFRSTDPDPAQQLAYKETLSSIDALFVDDPDVAKVMEAMTERFDPPEIRQLYDFSQPKYNATVLRMRRRIEKFGISDPTGEQTYVQ